MEALSPAGVIGAIVGLIIGWIDYKVAGGWVEGRLRATDRSKTAAEKADYERRIGWFRRIWFVATVVAFPIIGYWLGRTIGG